MEEKKALAHDLETKFRTLDAEINKNVTFESLMLSQAVLAGELFVVCFFFLISNSIFYHQYNRFECKQLSLPISNSNKSYSIG